jgi:hypothetical protein
LQYGGLQNFVCTDCSLANANGDVFHFTNLGGGGGSNAGRYWVFNGGGISSTGGNVFAGGGSSYCGLTFVGVSISTAYTPDMGCGPVTLINSSINSVDFPFDYYPFTGEMLTLHSSPINGVEMAAPSGVASSDLIYADSGAHRWKMKNNNGAADTVAGLSDFAAPPSIGSGTPGAITGTALNSTGGNAFGGAATYSSAACETSFATTTLGTGATTTDTGLNCLPANSVIDAVVARVTTTITAACTGWELGDASTAARFSSNNTTLTAGTTTDATHIGTFNNTGIASATTGTWQATAAKVRITCAGGNPGAGAIRIIVFYHTSTAPTS